MKILVLGHMGFIGSHFWKSLQGNKLMSGIDLKNGEDCIDLFKTSVMQWDLIIHCAAIVGGRINIERNPIAVATDLSIDAEFFNWVIKSKQPRVVYFSSSAAYPIELQEIKHVWKQYKGDGILEAERIVHNLQEKDIDLKEIKNPDMTYGWAKLTGEMLAEYARKQGVNVHVFRPFSGYGEDQDLDYPFPSFIKRIKDKVSEFEIWGNGEQIRDFIHVDDIVEAVMKAVESDIQEPINLGSGVGVSFNELAEMMMDISGHKVPIVHKLDKPVGVQYRVSDNSKMLEFYKPKISLEEGIKRALYEQERI